MSLNIRLLACGVEVKLWSGPHDIDSFKELILAKLHLQATHGLGKLVTQLMR